MGMTHLGVQVSLWHTDGVSCRYMPGVGSSDSSLLRNCNTTFPSCCTNLHSCQQSITYSTLTREDPISRYRHILSPPRIWRRDNPPISLLLQKVRFHLCTCLLGLRLLCIYFKRLLTLLIHSDQRWLWNPHVWSWVSLTISITLSALWLMFMFVTLAPRPPTISTKQNKTIVSDILTFRWKNEGL